MFIVGNRSFKNELDAKKYCIECDFDYSMIQEEEKEIIELSLFEKCKKGIMKVNNFNKTVSRKKEHEVKLYEIKNLYYEFMEINNCLFDADYEYNWLEYKKEIGLGKTKKELDNKLRLCLMYLNRQLNAIIRECC